VRGGRGEVLVRHYFFKKNAHFQETWTPKKIVILGRKLPLWLASDWKKKLRSRAEFFRIAHTHSHSLRVLRIENDPFPDSHSLMIKGNDHRWSTSTSTCITYLHILVRWTSLSGYFSRSWFKCGHMVVKTPLYSTRKCGCKCSVMSACSRLQPPYNGSTGQVPRTELLKTIAIHRNTHVHLLAGRIPSQDIPWQRFNWSGPPHGTPKNYCNP